MFRKILIGFAVLLLLLVATAAIYLQRVNDYQADGRIDLDILDRPVTVIRDPFFRIGNQTTRICTRPVPHRRFGLSAENGRTWPGPGAYSCCLIPNSKKGVGECSAKY